MGVFRTDCSDLSHMGVYTGMGVISIWALLRANMVCEKANKEIEAQQTYSGGTSWERHRKQFHYNSEQ